jgi:hypothetical protein
MSAELAYFVVGALGMAAIIQTKAPWWVGILAGLFVGLVVFPMIDWVFA